MDPLRIMSFACLLALALGCGDRNAPLSSGEPVVVDSAGVQIVSNETPLWGSRPAWTVDPEPALSIGLLEGPEEYLLHRVSAAARLSDGRLAVAVTGGEPGVRLYAGDGTYLGSVGGSGRGPGELRQPGQLHVVAGDTLVIWDLGNLRINWFDRDGRFLRDRPVDLSEFQLRSLQRLPASSMVDASLMPDGSMLVRLTEIAGGPPPEGLVRRRHVLVRASVESSTWDTVAVFRDAEEMRIVVTQARGSATMGFSPPQAKRGSIAFGGVPSRVCVGEQNEPDVGCYGADGVERRIRWPSSPRRLSEGDLATWRGGIARDRPDLEQALAGMPIPEFRPPYARIFLDDLLNLWVEIPRGLDEQSRPIDHEVFDPEGRWLGKVVLPPLQLLEIGDDYVIGLHRDGLGVESVRVHRLSKAAGP
jgi:hypothetical protein